MIFVPLNNCVTEMHINSFGAGVTEISVKIKHFIGWVREFITRVRKGRISPSACFTRDQGMIL